VSNYRPHATQETDMTALTATPDLLRAVHDEQLRQANTARRIIQAQRATARTAVAHGRSWARFTLQARINSRAV
jgi:hypothetical protein